jgi:hypothetical protein
MFFLPTLLEMYQNAESIIMLKFKIFLLTGVIAVKPRKLTPALISFKFVT